MAVFSTNTHANTRASGPSFFERFDAVFTAIARARTCAQDAEAFAQMSDAELSRRGLTRATAVRHAARAYL